jgi:hypothetical protein
MIEWQLVDDVVYTITLQQWLNFKNKFGSGMVQGVSDYRNQSTETRETEFILSDYRYMMRRKIRRYIQLSKLK